MTPEEMSLSVVQQFIDPLGLMPDDELTLHLAINKAIREARSEALEEAARVVEGLLEGEGWQHRDEIAAAIRALSHMESE